MITAERLTRDLRQAGIGVGQRVVVHSSLKSIGKVSGGAGAVVDALQSALTPTGTLVMPTFTYSLKRWTPEPYNPAVTPSRTGLITETLRLRPDARRTAHPTHSFAIWGAHADEIAAAHLDAVGRRSPLGWLLDHGGLIVQIGTDQDTNTSLHLCEELAEVPYLGVAFTPGQSFEIAHRRLPGRPVEEVRVEPCPGSSRGFMRIAPALTAAGIVREVQVGQARTLVTALPALVSVAVPVLRRHPGLLLSVDPDDENGQSRRLAVHRDRARWETDLIDLFIEGFPGAGRLTWPERESVPAEASRRAGEALALLLRGGHPSPTDLRLHLQRAGIRVEVLDGDAFGYSLWDPAERRILIWRGALARLARLMRDSTVPCAAPLRDLRETDLADLALAHEGFHVLAPTRGESLRARLADEVAARLFADALLHLPLPALLVDVFLMHWAPAGADFVPPAPEEL